MIHLDNLSFQYPDGYCAIKNLTAQIDSNTCIGIIGANGAGKSTLLQLLVGILLPQTGTIEIDTLKVEKKTLSKIRSKIGIVFQNPDDQLFTTSVYEDIAFGLRNQGMKEDEINQKVHHVLNLLEIPQIIDKAPYKLSGGEKKRASIAAILAMEPEILLFDEPSAFLDPKSRRDLIQTLRNIPLTKIIASHDLDLVAKLCDKVMLLSYGSSAAFGGTIEILSNQQLLLNCGL